jgi:ABC-2 type transport system ATP-binding protein
MIRITEVTKRYGNTLAVDGLSLHVRPGEIFAFLGHNGAGKSTTIKMITTALRPSSGTITVAQHDVVRDAHAVRQEFGIVFQESSLDEILTVEETLELHGVLYGMQKPLRRARIEELLQLFSIADLRRAPTSQLSGGLKRRLEIARALLHAPKILILDEPTLGLDAQARQQLWSYVQQLNARHALTVFFTTHYLEEAERFAHRVSVMHRGRLVVTGTPEEIKRQQLVGTLEAAYIRLTSESARNDAPAGGSGAVAQLPTRRLGT